MQSLTKNIYFSLLHWLICQKKRFTFFTNVSLGAAVSHFTRDHKSCFSFHGYLFWKLTAHCSFADDASQGQMSNFILQAKQTWQSIVTIKKCPFPQLALLAG